MIILFNFKTIFYTNVILPYLFTCMYSPLNVSGYWTLNKLLLLLLPSPPKGSARVLQCSRFVCQFVCVCVSLFVCLSASISQKPLIGFTWFVYRRWDVAAARSSSKMIQIWIWIRILWRILWRFSASVSISKKPMIRFTWICLQKVGCTRGSVLLEDDPDLNPDPDFMTIFF